MQVCSATLQECCCPTICWMPRLPQGWVLNWHSCMCRWRSLRGTELRQKYQWHGTGYSSHPSMWSPYVLMLSMSGHPSIAQCRVSRPIASWRSSLTCVNCEGVIEARQRGHESRFSVINQRSRHLTQNTWPQMFWRGSRNTFMQMAHVWSGSGSGSNWSKSKLYFQFCFAIILIRVLEW